MKRVIIIIAFLTFTSSQGIDFSGLIVAGGIFAVVIGFATQSVIRFVNKYACLCKSSRWKR